MFVTNNLFHQIDRLTTLDAAFGVRVVIPNSIMKSGLSVAATLHVTKILFKKAQGALTSPDLGIMDRLDSDKIF